MINKDTIKLQKYLLGYDKKFKWGESDCALFVAGAVDAQTGSSYLKQYQGSYNSALGALKFLKNLGFNNLEELYASMFEEVEVNHAVNGDIVLFKEDNRMTSGIFYLGRIIASTEEGLKLFPLEYAVKFWRVEIDG